MSGFKHATVTISQEEYRRLQQADIRNRFTKINEFRSGPSDHDEVVRSLLNQLEERERQFQAALAATDQSMSQTDDRFFQSILNQNALYYENLVATIRTTNLDIEESFANLTENIFRDIQADRVLINQSLQSIILEQESYQYNEDVKSYAAQQWLDGCFLLVGFLQNQFDHERFNPGRLERILRNLQIAEANFNNGFFESSLQTSQQMYLELTDMNFELEQLLFQWQTGYDQTCNAIDELVFQMVSNGKVNAIGLQGEELPNLVDLNYWTNGRFVQLLSHARQLSYNLAQEQDILTVEDLDRIYYQILPVIRETFGNLISDARFSALNSQLRMNIADKALEALENHGYSLDSSGYSDEDMRSEYNAHLAMADGSEVTIKVLPTENSSQELTNELVVITTHPYLKTDHEARLQWEELSQTLTQYNLKVSRPEIGSNSPSFISAPSREQTVSEKKYTEVER
jgi:hypothetical protein